MLEEKIQKKEGTKVKLITTFNPALPNIRVQGPVKKHIHYLHSNDILKKVFHHKKFSVIYKRSRNLKRKW